MKNKLTTNDKMLLEGSKDIDTSIIKQDIKDTEIEIEDYENKIKGYSILRDRLSAIRVNAYKNWVGDRVIFIGDLKRILILRELKNEK